jgi:hypothetical protein
MTEQLALIPGAVPRPLINVCRAAKLSPCGRHRYSLERIWDPDGTRVCWIMANPSTAGSVVDDATIRRCIDFSHRWGHGRLEVVNLCSWRATDPRDVDCAIRQRGLHVVSGGGENLRAIRRARRRADVVVAAWGNCLGRAVEPLVAALLAEPVGPPLMCLGQTKSGAPRHPVRVGKLQQLEPWP